MTTCGLGFMQLEAQTDTCGYLAISATLRNSSDIKGAFKVFYLTTLSAFTLYLDAIGFTG